MDFKSIRKSLDLTQAEIAEKLGVSPGLVGDIERGHRKVSLNLAVKLEGLTALPIVAEWTAERTGTSL